MADELTTDEDKKRADSDLVCVVDDDPVQRHELADYLRYMNSPITCATRVSGLTRSPTVPWR